MISKISVDLLRMASASGKKSIPEIKQPLLKQSSQLRYTGPVEYKTIPIEMPQILQKAGVTFEWVKKNLFPNKPLHDVLEYWFKLCEPVKLTRIEKECRKFNKIEYINKIKFFKTLSREEKMCLAESYADPQFITTLTGHKPAWYNEHGFDGKIDFTKIKLNPEVADKYDVVKIPHPLSSSGSLYFLNKKEVLKVIEENKDLYSTALGFKPNDDIEMIYKALLKNLENGNLNEALFGITLGFPRHSSMIFNMERLLEERYTVCRSNIPEFKKKLLELLHSDKSPFAGYPESTIQKLEKHIKEMDTINSGGDTIHYVSFGNENEAIKKTKLLEKDFVENFKIEDLM